MRCLQTPAEQRLYQRLLERPTTTRRIVRELEATHEARTEERVRRDLAELVAGGFARVVVGFGFVWCEEDPDAEAPRGR
jgi:hypothetical protein